LGLGVTIARARRITEPILTAAAEALAKLPDPTPGAPLLPPIGNLRAVSAAVAIAVAVTATNQGLAQRPVSDPVQQVHQAMWRPEYPRIDINLDPTITR
jgi:malate dehydrogenase (oxaloacetate-decarboxylating)